MKRTSWQDLYQSGEYAEEHPTWHAEDSPWKAKQVLRMIRRNGLVPKTICEVGCGAGEILRQLQEGLSGDCTLWGYEISTAAYELCKQRSNERLHFKLKDIIREDHGISFDLILLIDLIEHLEDYFGFLRQLKHRSEYKILHIPLDLSVQAVSRGKPLMALRRSYGHIHVFSKEIALAILQDVGYDVLDLFYTAGALERPLPSRSAAITRQLRHLLFAVNPELAVRTLGGFSLMVLAR